MPSLFGDDLVDEKRAKKRARKPSAASDGIVLRLEAVYREEFRRKWNAFTRDGSLIEPEVKPYFAPGRDRRHMKDMAAAWGEETVAQLIREFFASTDPQITSRDYKVAVLFQQAQRLLLEARRGRRLDRRTAEHIDAATRAVRKR